MSPELLMVNDSGRPQIQLWLTGTFLLLIIFLANIVFFYKIFENFIVDIKLLIKNINQNFQARATLTLT